MFSLSKKIEFKEKFRMIFGDSLTFNKAIVNLEDENERNHFLPFPTSFFFSPFSFSALSFVTALFSSSLELAFFSDFLFYSLLSLGTDLLPFPFSTADSLVFSLLMTLKSYPSRPYFFFHFSTDSL